MRALWVSALAAAALVFASSSARAVSVSDGDFETPVVSPGSFQNFDSGAAIGGWSVVGSQASVVSGSFTQNGFTFDAESGVQWLDLTGDGSNASEGVVQTVATTPGTNYSITFWVGNIVNPDGIFGTTSTVDLFVDDSLLLAAENTGGAGTSLQNWKEFTVPFKAGASQTDIEFLNADPSSDNTNGLDNISVALGSAGPPPSVPLPSAAWQVLALFSLLAGAKVCQGFWKRANA